MTKTLIYIFIFFLLVSSSFGQVHPVIKTIFYNLPLQKFRKQLREVIVNDNRFISTDTVFNNYKTSSFFKGITANKDVIKSKPDSIKIMLVYGNTELAIAKGQPSAFKNVMILDCKYYYFSKDSVEIEYGRLLNRLHLIFKSSKTIMNEAPYPKGIEKIIGKKFESFDPYYDIILSAASIVTANGYKSIFGLYLVFRKEDN